MAIFWKKAWPHFVLERLGFARAFCGALPPYTRHKCRRRDRSTVLTRVWAISHVRMMIGIISGMTMRKMTVFEMIISWLDSWDSCRMVLWILMSMFWDVLSMKCLTRFVATSVKNTAWTPGWELSSHSRARDSRRAPEGMGGIQGLQEWSRDWTTKH